MGEKQQVGLGGMEMGRWWKNREKVEKEKKGRKEKEMGKEGKEGE